MENSVNILATKNSNQKNGFNESPSSITKANYNNKKNNMENLNFNDVKIGDQLMDKSDKYYLHIVISLNSELINIGWNTYVKQIKCKTFSKTGREVGFTTFNFSETETGEIIKYTHSNLIKV